MIPRAANAVPVPLFVTVRKARGPFPIRTLLNVPALRVNCFQPLPATRIPRPGYAVSRLHPIAARLRQRIPQYFFPFPAPALANALQLLRILESWTADYPKPAQSVFRARHGVPLVRLPTAKSDHRPIFLTAAGVGPANPGATLLCLFAVRF